MLGNEKRGKFTPSGTGFSVQGTGVEGAGMIDIAAYLNKQTLILGDVRSGKTEMTRRLLDAFTRAGHGGRTGVLDLAPNRILGVGGKLRPPAGSPVRYLTTAIQAPRLTGESHADMMRMAAQNARRIEDLFVQLEKTRAEILFVNDATLYLHAGDPSRFDAILSLAATRIVNAYYGRTFADSALTRRETRLVEKLRMKSDRVIYLSQAPPDTGGRRQLPEGPTGR